MTTSSLPGVQQPTNSGDSGPFRIWERVNEICYKLYMLSYYRVSLTFYVFFLKPVVPGPLDKTTPDELPSPPVVIDGAPVYAVCRLLDSRQRGGRHNTC